MVFPELGYRHRRDDPAEHAAAPPPVRLRRLAAQRDAAGVRDHPSGATATRAPPDGSADGVREEHRDDMACHDRGVRSHQQMYTLSDTPWGIWDRLVHLTRL